MVVKERYVCTLLMVSWQMLKSDYHGVDFVASGEVQMLLLSGCNRVAAYSSFTADSNG